LVPALEDSRWLALGTSSNARTVIWLRPCGDQWAFLSILSRLHAGSRACGSSRLHICLPQVRVLVAYASIRPVQTPSEANTRISPFICAAFSFRSILHCLYMFRAFHYYLKLVVIVCLSGSQPIAD
jgi:hypothetical protein